MQLQLHTLLVQTSPIYARDKKCVLHACIRELVHCILHVYNTTNENTEYKTCQGYTAAAAVMTLTDVGMEGLTEEEERREIKPGPHSKIMTFTTSPFPCGSDLRREREILLLFAASANKKHVCVPSNSPRLRERLYSLRGEIPLWEILFGAEIRLHQEEEHSKLWMPPSLIPTVPYARQRERRERGEGGERETQS